MTRQRCWSDYEDKEVVKMLSEGVKMRDICDHLGRSEKSVRNRCSRLKIDVCAVRRKNKAESFDAADVRCPFFCSFSKGKSIKCEGLTDNSFISLSFSDEKEWMEQVRCFCNDGYRGCKLYGMLDGVYASKRN